MELTHPPVESFLEVGGLRHHLLTWDGGGGTTVLLAHGYLDLAWTWAFTMEALGAGCPWHVVAFDWRGHGDSDRVAAGGYYHFADYVRDLAGLAAAVRRDRLVYVGHSMGAAVGSLWLGARPGAADALVMVEGLGPPPVTLDEYPDRVAQWLDETVPFDPDRFEKPMDDLAHAERRMMRLDPRLRPEQARFLAPRATRLGPDGKLRWRYDPLHRTRSPLPLLPEVAGAFWRRLRGPVCWIGGAESPWAGPALEERLAAIPGLTSRHLPGAGHMVQHHQPTPLAAALREFIGDVATEGPGGES